VRDDSEFKSRRSENIKQIKFHCEVDFFIYIKFIEGIANFKLIT
jgi:hypothetical protein